MPFLLPLLLAASLLAVGGWSRAPRRVLWGAGLGATLFLVPANLVAGYTAAMWSLGPNAERTGRLLLIGLMVVGIGAMLGAGLGGLWAFVPKRGQRGPAAQ